MEKELPAKFLISFDKYLKYYDRMLEEGNALQKERARQILEHQKPYPEIREGFPEVEKLETYREVLEVILQDAFSGVLSKNEIKALSLPYHNVLFNPSERLQSIIDAAGAEYIPNLTNRGKEGLEYIMGATVILNFYYGFKLDYTRPFFFDIPDKDGVMQYYRIMYNADFVEVFPTHEAPEITQQDVDELLDRPEDIEFWKTKIPPESFTFKGFVIANMFNVTPEQAISAIKSKLIDADKRSSDTFIEDLRETFRSFFQQKDVRVGFVTYNEEDNFFEKVAGNGFESYLLKEKDSESCELALCEGSYEKLMKDKAYFVVPDVEKYYKASNGQFIYKTLHDQQVGSAIFAPIAHQDKLLGVLEIVSGQVNALNGVNATKLDDVMPFIVSAVVRSKIEEENLIDAVIQHECTTVHDSVRWRFQQEAKKFIHDQLQDREPVFGEIAFEEVYPLYGQVDIRDSSRARNAAIQTDLMIQLSRAGDVLRMAAEQARLPIYDELLFRVKNHMDEIKDYLHTNSEQETLSFIKTEILPVFSHLKNLSPELRTAVESYEQGMDPDTNSYYDHRRNYDETVNKINKTLSGLLDFRQQDAQEMFPHYFERYKTDGVEHNMYIGDSIVADREFNSLYLSNLRLWQLQVMVEMENAHYNLKKELPVPLDVASLILVYNTSLGIRFRMDEKRFDVDGTYNARYEMIKKRIDKSRIKGSRERLTQAGKLVVVYSQKEDEQEYLRYFSYLKNKGYFTNNIEIVELEGLQGVAGLKAIRAEILYSQDDPGLETGKSLYTYEDLMKELED